MKTEQIELAKAVMAYIEAHPEQHNQGTWLHATPCGTAGCFAGWTALLSGATFAEEVDLERAARNSVQSWKIDSEGRLRDWMLGGYYPADAKTVAEYARDRLGLSKDNARVLFHSMNTRDQLRGMVDMLAEDPDVVLAEYFDTLPTDY